MYAILYVHCIKTWWSKKKLNKIASTYKFPESNKHLPHLLKRFHPKALFSLYSSETFRLQFPRIFVDVFALRLIFPHSSSYYCCHWIYSRRHSTSVPVNRLSLEARTCRCALVRVCMCVQQLHLNGTHRILSEENAILRRKRSLQHTIRSRIRMKAIIVPVYLMQIVCGYFVGKVV